nr:CBL-interacting serine/threonine-protein kinase 6-like [Arachis hypogaea]
MKVVGKEKVIKVGMMGQIKREISVMKLMKHPHFIALHEVMASKSKIYIAMELFQGRALQQNCHKEMHEGGPCEALPPPAYLRRRFLYHCDLKLENLLLDHNGNLKVSDFGLSTTFSEHLRQDGLLHITCGTSAYDDNLFAMYKKIYRGDFKCPPWFSGDARRLITKLLDPNPNSRIIISKIMESPWFKKPVPKNMLRGMKEEDEEEKEKEIEEKMKQPSTMNAFHIISLSEGFDLLRLFEEKKREGREGGDEVCDGGDGEQRDISTGGSGKGDEVRCKEEQQ